MQRALGSVPLLSTSSDGTVPHIFVQITSGFRERPIQTLCWGTKIPQRSKLQSTVEENVQATGLQKLQRLSRWTAELKMKI